MPASNSGSGLFFYQLHNIFYIFYAQINILSRIKFIRSNTVVIICFYSLFLFSHFIFLSLDDEIDESGEPTMWREVEDTINDEEDPMEDVFLSTLIGGESGFLISLI